MPWLVLTRAFAAVFGTKKLRRKCARWGDRRLDARIGFRLWFIRFLFYILKHVWGHLTEARSTRSCSTAVVVKDYRGLFQQMVYRCQKQQWPSSSNKKREQQLVPSMSSSHRSRISNTFNVTGVSSSLASALNGVVPFSVLVMCKLSPSYLQHTSHNSLAP